MIEETQVKLGERTYLIEEQPLRPSRAWRERLDEPLQEIFSLAAQGELDLNNAQAVVELADQVRRHLASSVDTLTELVLAWDARMEADREYILDHAYPSQIMEAFTTILKYAYPFGQVVGAIRRLSSGQIDAPTSTSSPVPNGASGQTSLTPSL